MEIETQDQSADVRREDAPGTRKAWVTPVVSESPVNEFTQLAVGSGADGGIYS
jgi:hypothetical protein